MISDERILLLKNKVYKEYLGIMVIISILYEVYERFITGKATIILPVVLGALIYKEIRFSIEGANSFNVLSITKYYIIIFLFVFECFDLLYNFLGPGRHFLYEIIALILNIIIPVIFLVAIKILNIRWQRQNFN
ncbi:MAG: hypothetical protein ACYDG2_02010 [Ruminiclostridium sp.]